MYFKKITNIYQKFIKKLIKKLRIIFVYIFLINLNKDIFYYKSCIRGKKLEFIFLCSNIISTKLKNNTLKQKLKSLIIIIK